MTDFAAPADPASLAERCADLHDDTPFETARNEADELGARTLDGVTTDLVQQLARLLDVRAAVCISPAPAIPALAILSATGPGIGMSLIDDDPHHIEAARKSLREAGHESSSVRCIAARPLDVLEKLADGNYDLLVADVPESSVPAVINRSAKLLRRGGALLVRGIHSPSADDVSIGDQALLTALPVGDHGVTLITF